MMNRTIMASLVALLLLSFLCLSSSTTLHQHREEIDNVHLENTTFLSADPNQNHLAAGAAGTWCVVKPSTPWHVLKGLIVFCCTKVICVDILPGGKCFDPPNKVSDASVAMNLLYKLGGAKPEDCNFNGYGLLLDQDPSIGLCAYP